jgi:hypothetical protein
MIHKMKKNDSVQKRNPTTSKEANEPKQKQ